MSNYSEEISRRRTFAIISHPDAGKTTLTEKFLLYHGETCRLRLDGDREGEGNFRDLLRAAV